MSTKTTATLYRLHQDRRVGNLELAEERIALLEAELSDWKSHGRRLSSIFERAPVAIFVKDDEGRYVHANPTAAMVLGRDLESLIGLSDRELFDEPAAIEIHDIDQFVIATNRPFRYEARRMTGGGERVFQTTKWPWIPEAGGAAGIIAMARDVTDQKDAIEYRTLQSAISRELSEAASLGGRLESLTTSIRTVFNADVGFLWKPVEQDHLRMVSACVARPGFGEALIDHSNREPVQRGQGAVGESWSTQRPVVSAPDDRHERERLAADLGLSTIITIPVVTVRETAIIELMTTERRAATEPFVANLAEASRRIGDVAVRSFLEERIAALEASG